MATNLVSYIMQFLTPDLIGRIATALGLGRNETQTGVSAAVPALLAAISGVAAKPGGAQNLVDTIKQQSGVLDGFAGMIGGPIMMALLTSGQTDLVIAGAVAILRGIARGAPVVVVSGHLNRMSYALMSAKGLKTVADLKGKTIGITGIGGMGEFTVVESLRRNGLIKDRDFTLLNIEGGPAARIAALKSGKVHAVPLTPGQRVQAETDGFTLLLDTREILTEIPSTIVASTREFASSNPDKVVRFLRALGKAMDLIRRDREKAITLGRSHGLRGDSAIERKALEYYADDLDVRIKRENITALLKQIEIPEASQKYFDETYLTRAIGLR